MSENLPVGQVASLQAYSPYFDLVAALNACSSDMPLGIEILLESHPLPTGSNVAVIENTICIPRKVLRKAFVTSRQLFFDHLKILGENIQLILDTSAVMLLFDPEYLTAANARKRIVLINEGQGHLKSDSQVKVQRDLWFTAGLLTSTLRRHTKSPTLWAHRKWLLGRNARSKVAGMEEISCVALLAAENHSRNYYSWDYIRWWTSIHPELLTGSEFEHINLDRSNTSNEVPQIIRIYLSWCLKHPSDTSGWSFLLWLLAWATSKSSLPASIRSNVGREVLDRAKHMKLRNESLWFFLRTLMNCEGISSDLRQDFMNEVESIASGGGERLDSRSHARATLDGHP